MPKPLTPDVGKLDKFVAIQAIVSGVTNALGEPVGAGGSGPPTWATLWSVYADIEAIDGREIFEGQQPRADVTHKVYLRSFADPLTQPGRIIPKMRVAWNGRFFNIASVINPGESLQGSLMILLCKEEW